QISAGHQSEDRQSARPRPAAAARRPRRRGDRMKRREFITLLCAVAAACDLAPRRGRAPSRGGIHHASDAPTMVVREKVCVCPAAVAVVENLAPDVVGILLTSA